MTRSEQISRLSSRRDDLVQTTGDNFDPASDALVDLFDERIYDLQMAEYMGAA